PPQSRGTRLRRGRLCSPGNPLKILRRDLPHNSLLVCPARRGGTVEIPFRVEYDVAVGICSIAAAGKVVQRGVGPTAAGVCQLENRAQVACPVASRGAVEIARPVPSTVRWLRAAKMKAVTSSS